MTTHRVIFPPPDYWTTRPMKENTMNDYIDLNEALPTDTVIYKADGISLAMTLAPNDGGLIPQLIIRTREMGVYRFMFGRSELEDLVSQCVDLSRRTPEEFDAMIAGLSQRNDGAQ